MRVRVDEPEVERNRNLRWRGITLDSFDGRLEKIRQDQANLRAASGLYTTRNHRGLGATHTQTFFIEPTNTPVLFVAPRAVAIQGSFLFINQDDDDGLTAFGRSQSRVSYRRTPIRSSRRRCLRADFTATRATKLALEGTDHEVFTNADDLVRALKSRR